MKYLHFLTLSLVITLFSCGMSQKPLDQVYNSETAIEQLETIEKAKILTEEELINLSVYVSCSTDEQLNGKTYTEILAEAKKTDVNQLLNSMDPSSELYQQRLSQDSTTNEEK